MADGDGLIPGGLVSHAASLRKKVNILPFDPSSADECFPVAKEFARTYVRHSNTGNVVPASVDLRYRTHGTWVSMRDATATVRRSPEDPAGPASSSNVSGVPETLHVEEFVVILSKGVIDEMPTMGQSESSSEEYPLLSSTEKSMDHLRAILNIIKGNLCRVALIVPTEEDVMETMVTEIGSVLRAKPTTMQSVSWLGAMAESALLGMPRCHAIIDSAGNSLSDFGHASVSWDGPSMIPVLNRDAPLLIFGSLGSTGSAILGELDNPTSQYISVNINFDGELPSTARLMKWWTGTPEIALMASIGTTLGVLTLSEDDHSHAMLTFLAGGLLRFYEHGASGLEIARALLLNMGGGTTSVTASKFANIPTISRDNTPAKPSRRSLEAPPRSRSRSVSRASLDSGPGGAGVSKSTANSRRDASRGRLGISRALVRNKFFAKKTKECAAEAGEILASLSKQRKEKGKEKELSDDDRMVDITNQISRQHPPSPAQPPSSEPETNPKDCDYLNESPGVENIPVNVSDRTEESIPEASPLLNAELTRKPKGPAKPASLNQGAPTHTFGDQLQSSDGTASQAGQASRNPQNDRLTGSTGSMRERPTENDPSQRPTNEVSQSLSRENPRRSRSELNQVDQGPASPGAGSVLSHVADPRLLVPHHVHEKFKNVREPSDLKKCVSERAKAISSAADARKSTLLDYQKIQAAGISRSGREDGDGEDTLTVGFCSTGSARKDQEVVRYENMNINEEFRSLVNQDVEVTPARLDLSSRLQRTESSKRQARVDWKKTLAERPRQDANGGAGASLFGRRDQSGSTPIVASRKGRSSGARQVEQLRAADPERRGRVATSTPEVSSGPGSTSEPVVERYKAQNDKAVDQITSDFLSILISGDCSEELRARGTKALRASAWAYLDGISEGEVNAKPVDALQVSKFCSVNAPLIVTNIMKGKR